MSWAEPRVLSRDGIDILNLRPPDVVPGIDAVTTVIDHVSAWQLTVTWTNGTDQPAVIEHLDALTAAITAKPSTIAATMATDYPCDHTGMADTTCTPVVCPPDPPTLFSSTPW